MKNKLVIWDFDGVIADSEKIYIENRQHSINDTFGLNWDIQTTFNYLGGLSDILNREVLNNLGYITDDKFWADLLIADHKRIISGDLNITPDVEKILNKLPKKCVATNSTLDKTIFKLEFINFWHKYFDESNIFTGDMVKKGKPEPDLFLYAADKMGELPQDCIVIEDSIAGMTAALRANMNIIAFLGCEMYLNDNYIQKVKDLGVKNICFTMSEVEKLL